MAIKITPQIRKYAMEVASIGERMRKTADEFGKVANKTVKNIDDIQNKKDDFLRLQNEFEMQEKDLLKIKAPALLSKDQSKLFTSFNKYVIASETVIRSLDVENVKTDEDILNQAQNLLWEASGEIVQTTNEIARKIGI